MQYELAKSKYCKGIQCPKMLWLDEHHPELGEDTSSQTVLDNGTKVGELGRAYFGKYELVEFQKQYYYSKVMQGSYSIKYVLPALWPGDPELDYHNLEGVHNSSEASASFADMVNHTPEDVIAEMRENLLKYCGLDTYAMVKVLKKLREIADNN